MYVCVRISSVFDNFISEIIQLTVSGETCVTPRAPEPLPMDEAEGSRRVFSQLSWDNLFNKKK